MSKAWKEKIKSYTEKQTHDYNEAKTDLWLLANTK
jgi:hypothetical protein